MYTKQEKKYIIAAVTAVVITICIIIFSEQAFEAAIEGLEVWWNVVFPSLLPFFIIAEILMGLGVVHFLGALLEPLMRPVFKVPGVGAFAMAMGLASGYPIGAKITGNLRRKNLCSKTEAERLVAFTNTADPLFMIGAVAVGMFHRAELGIILAAAHYISSLIVGFSLRFYKGEEDRTILKSSSYQKRRKNIFSYAIDELVEARKKDGRSTGELIGDSIKESINTLLLVGGFIILFSVLTRMFLVTGIITIISNFLINILHPLGFTEAMVLPLVSGFFEISNGTNLASQAVAPLLHQVIIASAIIAWSGMSVHAQVATMINGTDIRLKPYIFARILQSILAGILTIFLFRPFQGAVETTFMPFLQGFNTQRGFMFISLIFISLLTITLTISLGIYFLQRIKIIIFYNK
ncbi:sporulation integral membrane protein YlbJ [Natronospora cellulosivora (SeqCode)]